MKNSNMSNFSNYQPEVKTNFKFYTPPKVKKEFLTIYKGGSCCFNVEATRTYELEQYAGVNVAYDAGEQLLALQLVKQLDFCSFPLKEM